MWKKTRSDNGRDMLFHGKLSVQRSPSVFTTLQNGMDASPTERQSTGTVLCSR